MNTRSNLNKTASFAPDGYGVWYQTGEGRFALECTLHLIRKLLAGWPRRSRSLLVMQAGLDIFLEQAWEAGFDVTAQESDPAVHASLCAGGDHRFSRILAASDHLPCDDGTFDYVLAVAGVEFWNNPEEVLAEIKRVCCGGCILLFPSWLSLFAAEQHLRRLWHKSVAFPGRFIFPFRIAGVLRKTFPDAATVYYSTLHLPSAVWLSKWAGGLSSFVLRAPFGGVAGVRVDREPQCPGTGLPLYTRRPLPEEPSACG